ncbi:MAG: peptidoglycan DD-metalloendopeptidase family protein [Xenococcus sp. MO_188.B8]|nr:peptidoglycan DD-metalloendopeptidase family protein [Xenococcus sp. MO_188.B8]
MFPYRFPTALITTLVIVQPQMVIAQDIAKINNIARNITVKVTGYGNGSGVIFEKEENVYSVVTNQHVVPIDIDYEIRTNDGIKHQVISRQEIPGFDLAIVQFESEQSYQIATIGDSDRINALQKIYVAGFPGETTDIDIISGEIRSIRQEILQNPQPEKGYALIYTNQTLPGSSGGAVLDENGLLIGINGEGKRELKSGRDISRGIPINLFLRSKEELSIAIDNTSENQLLALKQNINLDNAPENQLLTLYNDTNNSNINILKQYIKVVSGNDNTSILNDYILPARGTIISGYGWRWGRLHKGIDIAAPIGTPIMAAASGEVIFAGWNSGGYGNVVKLKHFNDTITFYAHNSKILVRKGQKVEQGQQIAEMGSTGYSTGPHLHFEIRLPDKDNIIPLDLRDLDPLS